MLEQGQFVPTAERLPIHTISTARHKVSWTLVMTTAALLMVMKHHNVEEPDAQKDVAGDVVPHEPQPLVVFVADGIEESTPVRQNASQEEKNAADDIVHHMIKSADYQKVFSILTTLPLPNIPTGEDFFKLYKKLNSEDQQRMLALARHIEKHPEETLVVGASFRKEISKQIMFGESILNALRKKKSAESECMDAVQNSSGEEMTPEHFQELAREFLHRVERESEPQKVVAAK